MVGEMQHVDQHGRVYRRGQGAEDAAEPPGLRFVQPVSGPDQRRGPDREHREHRPVRRAVLGELAGRRQHGQWLRSTTASSTVPTAFAVGMC